MKILIASPIFADSIEKLSIEHDVIEAFNAPPEELAALIPDRQALVFRSGVDITADVMARAPDLKLLIRAGSGLDNLDLDYVKANGIELVRVPEPGARAVAELGFSLMLALARQILKADSLLRDGHWAKHELTGYLLQGKTLGIYGAGSIGSLMGRMGHAWDMNVVGCVKNACEHRAASLEEQHIRLADADEVVSTADFLSINVPLNDDTRGLIGADTLARMKAGSFLVNLARGGIVDEQALLDVLTSGHLAGAALDVHQQEGDGKVSPLAALSNTILTPHIGAMTIDSQRAIGGRVIEIVEQRS
ncbi:MAG: hydroxyacid dehydrogenase [Gammaproteobacteria bacterium]|nr:hydroxyacid dehydrogenase [Gammaproteobacteria bacterium]